jgi:hypothetical protein
MRIRHLCLLLSFLAGVPAYAEEISGTYVGQGSGTAFLFQLVETAGRQLSGRFEQTVLEPSGKLAQSGAPITGASDGHTVAITVWPGGLFTRSTTLSGTLDGLQLHISGVGDKGKIDLPLRKLDETAYRAEVANLAAQAKFLNEAQAKADLLDRLIKLTDNMLSYSTEANAQLSKFPPIEQRLRTLTGVMNSALVRERSIYGDGQASVARGQISVAINQAGMEAEELHNSMQTADQHIGNILRELGKNASEVATHCQVSDQDDDLSVACSKFKEAGTKLRTSIAALAEAFKRAEQVWTEEHRKQQAIVHSSDLASR